MKIAIDCSQIIYGTGVSVYLENLIKNMLRLDSKNEFVLFGGSLRRYFQLRKLLKNHFSIGERVPEIKVYPVPPRIADIIWNRLHIFPIEYFVGRVDTFHSSDWTQPPSSAFKVTTIHDLSPIRFPEVLDPKIVSVHKARLQWVKKEVDRIIAVSNFTKQEIIYLLGVKPERVTVVYEAADPLIVKADFDKIKKVKDRYKLGNYLLVVGASTRKNLKNIITSYGIFKSKFGNVGSRLDLVIVGSQKEKEAGGKGIKYLGYVSKDDLVALYSAAEALVYTSFYEGFGLPILEAMQAECPVVTSNVSSMPEIAGDAAVLVNPYQPEEIAAGIEKALKNRKEWIEKGRKQAKKFSWEKIASQTLEIYKENFRN